MKQENIELFTASLLQDFQHTCHTVSFGKKTVAGVATDTDSLVFHVEKKIDDHLLSDEDLIPSAVVVPGGKTFLTDVVESKPFHFGVDIRGCEGFEIEEWAKRHNQRVKKAGVCIGNQLNLPFKDHSFIGTMGHIGIDLYDQTLCGLTCSHVVVGHPFLTSSYKPLQDAKEKIWNDNLLADNTGCPMIPVWQPNEEYDDIDNTGDPAVILGPVKRYAPYRPPPAVNLLDVAVIAITGNPLPIDSWQQLNFMRSEDIKEENVNVIPKSGIIKENYTVPYYWGLPLDDEDLPPRTLIADIEIQHNTDYRYYYTHLSGEYSRYFEIELPDMEYDGTRPGNPKLYLNNYSLLNKDIKDTLTASILTKDYHTVTREPDAIEIEYHPVTKIPFTTMEPILKEYTLHVKDDNEPAIMGLEEDYFVFPENKPVNSGIFLTYIKLEDPNDNDQDEEKIINYNTLSLFGIDAPYFMLVPSGTVVDENQTEMRDPSFGRYLELETDERVAALYFKPTVEQFDYERKHEYTISVQLEDMSIQKKAGPVMETARVEITDVNQFVDNLYIVPEILSIDEENFKLETDKSTRATEKQIKVADLYYTEPEDPYPDIMENMVFDIKDDPNDLFILKNDSPARASLYIRANRVFNFEVQSTFIVDVEVRDASIQDSPSITKRFTLNIADIKDPPTEMNINIEVDTLTENTVLTEDLHLATFSFVDEDSIDTTYIIVGDYSSSFIIKDDKLYMLNGTTINYERISEYKLTIYAYDQYIPGSKPLSVDYTLYITDVNEPGDTTPTPPAASPNFILTPVITNLDEYEDTTNPIIVATLQTDILLTTDDEFKISGPDKDNFVVTVTGTNTAKVEILENVEFRYDSQTHYYIIVELLRDGWTVDAKEYTLYINDTNRFPTGIAILNERLTIKENAYRAAFPSPTDVLTNNTPILVNVPLGFPIFQDDNDGSVKLVVSPDPLYPDDAQYFTIIRGILYLKQGTILNYELKPFYQIRIAVEDGTAVDQQELYTTYRLDVIDVNENPLLLVRQNGLDEINEDINTNVPNKIATFTLSDPDQDTLFYLGNELRIFGHDSAYFYMEQTSSSTNTSVWDLYLKVGVVLDGVIKPEYNFKICAVDESLRALGNDPDSVCYPYKLVVNPAPKIRFLRTKIDAANPASYLIRDDFYAQDTPIAIIEGVNELGGVQCGKYTLEHGYPILENEEDYLQFFTITEGDCVEEAVLSIKAGSELRFWREGRNVFPLKIKCEQENGKDVFMDYVVEIYQPYLPLATSEDIDNLTKGQQVWLCGRTSGFSGQSACPVVIYEAKVATIVRPPLEEYYNREKLPELIFGDFISFTYENVDFVSTDFNPPARPGDSGSGVIAKIDGTFKIIGIFSIYNDKFSLACRADHLATMLDIKVDPEFHVADDPRLYYFSSQGYTKPEEWRYLYVDRLSGSLRRIKYWGMNPETNEPYPPQVFYQIGTYKASDLPPPL